MAWWGSLNWGGGGAYGRMVEFASCKPADALVYFTFLTTTATSTLVVGFFSGTTWDLGKLVRGH